MKGNVSENNNSKYQIRLPLYIFAALAAGILIGATFVSEEKPNWENIKENVEKFREIISNIEYHYVDPVDTDKLTESAINQMLEKLDPHSTYIPKRDIELAKSQIEGGFNGIGIEFNIFKDTIYVVAPLSGGPSEKLGIQSGDKIIKVDGEDVAGIGIKNRGVIDRLRGPKGSEVEVKIKRKGIDELLTFDITRDKIPQYSVDASYMIDDEIGYIKVSRFSTTTYEEFRTALTELKDQGMSRLILDLQDNPGGLMNAAIFMVDELLSGDRMIVYTKGKEERLSQEARASIEGSFENKPVIVLINEGSASASEIVSGALQDHDRALIVGRRSFGKGLVQMPIPLNDGSELRLTISRYYTPSGRSIQKPYEGGDQYDSDILKRYEHGEFFSADSIKFADSLKYKTTHGRTVYGGGGIMPDYFVPFDTSGTSGYLTRLIVSNALREFTFKYYSENKNKLEKMDLQDYIKKFEVTDKMLDELVGIAKTNKVEFNEAQFQTSKDLIKTNIKALIARNVWDNEAYYPIQNKYNEVLQRALELVDEAEDLALVN